MADQNIGAARVHLIVDATNWDSTLQQARSAAQQFGTDAERAFDKSSGGVRRASERLLDYVASLGRADTQMERYIRNAQRAGVDEPIIRAAINRWGEYQRQIQETNRALQEAAAMNRAFDTQRAAVSQREIGGLLGVGENDGAAQARRRADAEAALLPLLQQQERAYSSIYQEAQNINRARDEARRSQAQTDINSLLGVSEDDSDQRIRRQADARAALTGIIEEEIAAEQRLEAQRLKGQQFLQYLENLGNTAGKTHWEVLQLKAAQAGVSAEAMPMIQGLQEQAEAMNHAGITTNQYRWAMQGLPAQFTDIGVSLAGGQRPWLVLLQQGGQITNMFGSLSTAAKAVGQALMRMINPLTVTATVAAAAGYAWWKLGEDARNAADNIADISNEIGDIARMGYMARSEAEIRRFTDSLADLYDLKPGRLTAVLAGLDFADLTDESGKLVANVTELAGKSEDVRDNYVEMLNAMLSNTEQAADQLFAEGLITQQQRETVKALGEANRLEDARHIVSEGLLRLMQESLDLHRLTFPELTKEQDVLEKQAQNREEILRLQRSGGPVAANRIISLSAMNALLDDQLETLREIDGVGRRQAGRDAAQVQVAMEAAVEDLDRVRQRYGTLDQQRTIAIEEAKAEHARKLAAATSEEERALRKAVRDEELAGINATFDEREKRAAKQGGRRGGRGADGTAAIRDAMQAELAATATATRLLQSQYDQRELAVEDYYDKLRQYSGQELEITLRAIDLQKQAVAGREDAAERIERLESQAARAREQFSQQAIELADGERQAVLQREVAYRQFTRTMEDANRELERSMQSQVAAVSMGAQRHEQLERENDILREQDETLRDVRRQIEDRTISAEEGERRIQAAMENTITQMEIMRQGYDDLREAQSSFTNGAARALEDFAESSADVAIQGYQLVTSALDGFADATARALSGASGSFEQFFENLHVQILQFIVRQQLSKWVGSLMSGGGTDSQGNTMGSLFDLFGGEWGFAQGGTPGGGTAAYRNQIVSQPTIFPFARGGVPNMGVMGERSGRPHEAIMPLQRMSGGNLGVEVKDGRQSGPVNIDQTFVVQGTPDRTTREQLARKTGRETSRAMTRG